jgi:hypothetical protein
MVLLVGFCDDIVRSFAPGKKLNSEKSLTLEILRNRVSDESNIFHIRASVLPLLKYCCPEIRLRGVLNDVLRCF